MKKNIPTSNPSYDIIWNLKKKEELRLMATSESIDYTPWDDPKWNWKQKNEFRIATENGIDYTPWFDAKWNWKQMNEFRIATENGIDYTPWFDAKWNWKQMEQFRYATENGIDYTPWFDTKWKPEQMAEFSYAVMDNVDYTPWFDTKWSAKQMKQFVEEVFIEEVGKIDYNGNISFVALAESNLLVFGNTWTYSKRCFTYSLLTETWEVDCFEGTSEELLNKAKDDSEESFNGYSLAVDFVKNYEKLA